MKSKSVKTLKAKAWKIFSQYIRQRDRGVCFTCGLRYWNEELGEVDWHRTHAGHFIHNKLDFDEMNIHCQCVQCNKWKHGNLGIYALKMAGLYGLEAVEELERRSHQEKPYTIEYLDNVIEMYSEKLSTYI